MPTGTTTKTCQNPDCKHYRLGQSVASRQRTCSCGWIFPFKVK